MVHGSYRHNKQIVGDGLGQRQIGKLRYAYLTHVVEMLKHRLLAVKDGHSLLYSRKTFVNSLYRWVHRQYFSRKKLQPIW